SRGATVSGSRRRGEPSVKRRRAKRLANRCRGGAVRGAVRASDAVRSPPGAPALWHFTQQTLCNQRQRRAARLTFSTHMGLSQPKSLEPRPMHDSMSRIYQEHETRSATPKGRPPLRWQPPPGVLYPAGGALSIGDLLNLLGASATGSILRALGPGPR